MSLPETWERGAETGFYRFLVLGGPKQNGDRSLHATPSAWFCFVSLLPGVLFGTEGKAGIVQVISLNRCPDNKPVLECFCMKKKRIRKESDKTLLSRITKEMAEPRIAKSAQKEDLNPVLRSG